MSFYQYWKQVRSSLQNNADFLVIGEELRQIERRVSQNVILHLFSGTVTSKQEINRVERESLITKRLKDSKYQSRIDEICDLEFQKSLKRTSRQTRLQFIDRVKEFQPKQTKKNLTSRHKTLEVELVQKKPERQGVSTRNTLPSVNESSSTTPYRHKKKLFIEHIQRDIVPHIKYRPFVFIQNRTKRNQSPDRSQLAWIGNKNMKLGSRHNVKYKIRSMKNMDYNPYQCILANEHKTDYEKLVQLMTRSQIAQQRIKKTQINRKYLRFNTALDDDFIDSIKAKMELYDNAL